MGPSSCTLPDAISRELGQEVPWRRDDACIRWGHLPAPPKLWVVDQAPSAGGGPVDQARWAGGPNGPNGDTAEMQMTRVYVSFFCTIDGSVMGQR